MRRLKRISFIICVAYAFAVQAMGVATASGCADDGTPGSNGLDEAKELRESQRFQLSNGLSVCLPSEPRAIRRRTGFGLECKTSEGIYYAYCYTTRSGNATTAFAPAQSKEVVVSERQLEAVSDTMLNRQVAEITQDSGKRVLHVESARIGIYYARRISYSTQAAYGDGAVNAHTMVVALAPQSRVCQFTFVPSAACPSRTAIYAERFFATIRPAIQLGYPAK